MLKVVLLAVCSHVLVSSQVREISSRPGTYPAKWAALDKRPIPEWYEAGKIGVFIHWGVYSVPSYTSEWFWVDWKGNPSPNPKLQKKINEFMESNYKPGFSYQDFAPDLTAEFFNATQWVEIIKKSGAKYVVLTSKHHDGFAMWQTNYSFSWNSVDTGPHKDIVGKLAKAVRKNGLNFGLYHSLFEWFNPLYLTDKAANFTTQNFVNEKIIPEMKELVLKYKPELLWSDGEWEAPSSYWRSEEFLAWLYNESPVASSVVVNDRWGSDTLCKHGGYYTCSDRYNPGVVQNHKWENAMTIDKNSWGYSRTSNLNDYLTNQELIDTLVSTIACGGNLLMNVGPTKEGTISAIFQERLSTVGHWLKINGEAIYESSPWDVCQNDTFTPQVWFTTKDKGDTVYAIMLRWPRNGVLVLACAQIQKGTNITMVGVRGDLQATETDKHLTKISLPDKALALGDYGWVLKMKKLVLP